MQDKLLYEYAVVRLVPRVEREEFINVGVILYCSAHQYLKIKYQINTARLQIFDAAADADQFEAYLMAMDKICQGRREGGTIGSLSAASRFRWLTASRSTVIQASKVHSGFCSDPEQALLKLFDQQIS